MKLERKTALKQFVAAKDAQMRDLGELTIPFKTNEGIQRCIIFRSANVVKIFHFHAKSCRSRTNFGAE